MRRWVQSAAGLAAAATLLTGCGGQAEASSWHVCTWVYARDTGHRVLDIFALEDGEERRLTDGQRSYHPSLSPDGTRIVFTRGVGTESECCGFPHTELYLMNADGSGERRLLDGEGDDESPVWSPDGSMIAFIRHLPSRQALDSQRRDLVMVVPISGDRVGEPQVVAEVRPPRASDDTLTVESVGSAPAWSPDSTRLAWIHVTRTIAPPLDAESPAPHADARSPHTGVAPPGASPSPRPRPTTEVTIRWRTVDGSESGELPAPEGQRFGPVWEAEDTVVFTVHPPGRDEPDLVRVRLSNGAMESLRVPVVLPARFTAGETTRIAGIVRERDPDDSRLVVVDPDGGDTATVTTIPVRFPYHGMTISAHCPT